jgi:MATE family multidrug resistance protein
VVLPFASVWSFQLDGIFIGATRSKEMRNGALLAIVAFLIAAALLVPVWGNHGLWAAFVTWMVARTVPLAWWYPRIERALAPPSEHRESVARRG